MAQTTPIMQTLKSILKSRRMTYRQLGKALDLSEASIKRLFSEQSLSLQRLDQICQCLDIEISDVIKQMESKQQQLTQLTEEQEQELVKDSKLLLVAYVVINNWNFEDIISKYDLPETQIIRYLAKMDRMKLIDLLPNNRIRLRISSKFAWRQNGPIQQFFTEHLHNDFLKSRFDRERESMKFPSGILSRRSCEQIKRKLDQLVQDFHALNEQDRNLPMTERLSYSLFLAFRPWRPEVFEDIRRKDVS